MSNTILKGIKVVELGTHVAIPYTARMLSDMGADVIKIEPEAGESYRKVMGALFQLPHEKDYNICFYPYNVNKRDIVLDIKQDSAKEVIFKLLEDADIFLTNTREEVLNRLGLGLDYLHERFPRLVIGNVNGHGPKGPEKDRTGYDATSFWNPAGMMREWGYQEDNYQFKPFYGFGDAITAAQMTIGIVSALYYRDKYGKGDVVRCSLYSSGLWTNVIGLLRYQSGHKFPKAFDDPILPLDNYYRTKDGMWFLSPEEKWNERCEGYFKLFGTMELMDDPKWNSLAGYMDRSTYPEKIAYFQHHISRFTAKELDEGLRPYGVMMSYLGETDEVLENPQAWENDYLTKVTTQSGKTVTLPTIPWQMGSMGATTELKMTPELGEHTEQILKELGYTDEQIKEMESTKAAVQYQG